MANYPKLAQTAKRLIEKNGREVTLRREGTAPSDPAKPWRGGAATVEEVTLRAVILDYSIEESTSDHVKRGDKRAYVAQESATGVNLLEFNRLVESNGETWNIVRAEQLVPADVSLMYDLQLRQ